MFLNTTLRNAFGRFSGLFPAALGENGYNSRTERRAVRDLQEINQETGPLVGGSVVRVMEEDGKKFIFAWISPHCDDPFAVRLFQDGTVEYSLRDEPDESTKWHLERGDHISHIHARMVLEVINRHKEALFSKENPKMRLGMSRHFH